MCVCTKQHTMPLGLNDTFRYAAFFATLLALCIPGPVNTSAQHRSVTEQSILLYLRLGKRQRFALMLCFSLFRQICQKKANSSVARVITWPDTRRNSIALCPRILWFITACSRRACWVHRMSEMSSSLPFSHFLSLCRIITRPVAFFSFSGSICYKIV